MLEEDEFELAVPLRRERLWGATPGKHCRLGPEPVSGSALRADAGRDATRVRNTIVRVDQLEREKAGRSHRLQAASTSSTSIDSPEHGVPGAVFGRDADLDSHPPLRAQSCDPAMVHQHLEPNFILVESASPR